MRVTNRIYIVAWLCRVGRHVPAVEMESWSKPGASHTTELVGARACQVVALRSLVAAPGFGEHPHASFGLEVVIFW